MGAECKRNLLLLIGCSNSVEAGGTYCKCNFRDTKYHRMIEWDLTTPASARMSLRLSGKGFFLCPKADWD